MPGTNFIPLFPYNYLTTCIISHEKLHLTRAQIISVISKYHKYQTKKLLHISPNRLEVFSIRETQRFSVPFEFYLCRRFNGMNILSCWCITIINSSLWICIFVHCLMKDTNIFQIKPKNISIYRSRWS